MNRDFLRKHTMFYRSLTLVLLIIYLSIYPAIILCDLQCNISSRVAGVDHDIEDISHHHNHHHVDDTESHLPHHSPKDNTEKHSICLFAHSASSNGILTNKLHITGIFKVTMVHLFPGEKVISQTLDPNLHSRAPPLFVSTI